MAKEDLLQLEGKIIETLPNTTYKVELANGHIVLAYLSGKMRMFDINTNVGDEVILEMSPYDLKKGRIVKRK